MQQRYFLTGNRPEWFPKNPWYNLLELVRSTPNEGLLRYYSTTNLERVVITSPEGLRDILVTNFTDFDHMSLIKLGLKRMTGSDLADLPYEEFKLQRKQLAPSFSVPHTRSLAPEFFRQARRMISRIQQDVLNGDADAPVPLHSYVYRTTLDNIGLAGMGYDFGTLDNPESEVLHQYHKLGVVPTEAFNWVELMSHYVDFHWLLKVPVPKNLELFKGARFLYNVSLDIINKKRDKFMAGEKLLEREKKDIIAMALAEGGVMQNRPDHMADQVMALIQGGHDSTSASFDWAMYELGKRPDVQQRLRDEIRSHLGPSLEECDPAHIRDLPYLEAVISETLRCYPFLPIMLRETVHDTTIVSPCPSLALCSGRISHVPGQ